MRDLADFDHLYNLSDAALAAEVKRLRAEMKEHRYVLERSARGGPPLDLGVQEETARRLGMAVHEQEMRKRPY